MILNHCFVPVSDSEAALVFYRDLLGYEVRNDVKYEGNRWLTLVSPDQPEVQVVLETVGAGPDLSDEDRETMKRLLAKGVLARFLFASKDLEATYATLVEGGADIVQPIQAQDWGATDLAVRDPSGNLLRISQV